MQNINGHSDPDRAAINRANAEHSTGPITPEGKARSSQNALKHGLTSRAIVIPSDDPAAYRQHVKAFFDEYAPRDASEAQLVQALADIAWRRNRLVRLEAEVFTDDPEHPRSLEIQIRALNGLSMHGHRLAREFEATLKLLEERWKKRSRIEDELMKQAVDLYKMDKEKGVTFDPAAAGFVFSLDEIQTHIRREKRAEAAQEAAEAREEEE